MTISNEMKNDAQQQYYSHACIHSYVKNEGERKIFIRLKEGRQACKMALKWSIYIYIVQLLT